MESPFAAEDPILEDEPVVEEGGGDVPPMDPVEEAEVLAELEQLEVLDLALPPDEVDEDEEAEDGA